MQHIRNLVSKCLEKKQYLIFFILCKAPSFAWAYRSISIKTNFELDLQSWRKSAILCFILTKASVAEGFCFPNCQKQKQNVQKKVGKMSSIQLKGFWPIRKRFFIQHSRWGPLDGNTLFLPLQYCSTISTAVLQYKKESIAI